MESSTDKIIPETVEALLETIRALVRDEDGRGESLNARAGALAGFAGVTASLAGTLGANALSDQLGVARWIAAPALVTGLVALSAAVALVVFGVLWPRTYATISIQEIERYPTPEYVRLERVMAQGITLRGLIAVLATQRQRNAAKARWLKLGYATIMVGVALVVLATATLALTKAGAW